MQTSCRPNKVVVKPIKDCVHIACSQYKQSFFLSFLDEFGNDYETPAKKESANDEEPKMVMEDMNTETSTALVQNDANDPESIEHKGCKFVQLFCYTRNVLATIGFEGFLFIYKQND